MQALTRFAIPTIRRASANAASAARCHPAAAIPTAIRPFSGYGDSITYSGGQASEGQGGYYGSGGARASTKPTEHKPEMIAQAADVEKIGLIIQEVVHLEQILEDEKAESQESVTGKSLEISSRIKRFLTSPEVMEVLIRLEVDGEPVWGLSSEERDMVHAVRRKVNEC